jgi:hypothetical protein
LLELPQQPIPVWDACRLDVDVVLRDEGILTVGDRGIVTPDGGCD